MYQHTVFLGMSIMGPATLSVSLYLLASRWETLDATALGIFINLVASMTMVVVLVFRYASKLFAFSQKIKATHANGHLLQLLVDEKVNVRLLRRYWESYSVLKDRFFGTNFFDQTTTLVLLDFSLGMAINLILLRK